MRSLALLLAAVLSVGCTRNAVLSLELTASDGARFASVTIRRGDLDGGTLAAAAPKVVSLSAARDERIVSVSTERVGDTLLVDISQCSAASCTDAIPVARYSLRGALFVGRTTRRVLSVPIAGCPVESGAEGCAEVEVIDPCSIEGCATGDRTTYFCDSLGRHFCAAR